MTPQAKAATPEQDDLEQPAQSLTAEQLREIYYDPDDIIPEHTLDDLVEGMRRFYGFKER